MKRIDAIITRVRHYAASLPSRRNPIKEYRDAGKPVRVIYRCKFCQKAKRPHAVRSILYVNGPIRDTWVDPENPARYTDKDSKCPNCGRETFVNVVNGHYVADQACGGKCVNAVGESCECSCGGLNHGSGYTYHFVEGKK